MIEIDEPEPFEEIRREFAPWSNVRGIPFHITLLHPFARREELTEALLVDLRENLERAAEDLRALSA